MCEYLTLVYRLLFLAQHHERFLVHPSALRRIAPQSPRPRPDDYSDLRVTACRLGLREQRSGFAHHASPKADSVRDEHAHQTHQVHHSWVWH